MTLGWNSSDRGPLHNYSVMQSRSYSVMQSRSIVRSSDQVTLVVVSVGDGFG